MELVNQTDVATHDPASLNQQWFSAQSKAEFIEGAPHLKHPQLRRHCEALVREVFEKLDEKSQIPRDLNEK